MKQTIEELNGTIERFEDEFVEMETNKEQLKSSYQASLEGYRNAIAELEAKLEHATAATTTALPATVTATTTTATALPATVTATTTTTAALPATVTATTTTTAAFDDPAAPDYFKCKVVGCTEDWVGDHSLCAQHLASGSTDPALPAAPASRMEQMQHVMLQLRNVLPANFEKTAPLGCLRALKRPRKLETDPDNPWNSVTDTDWQLCKKVRNWSWNVYEKDSMETFWKGMK